MTDRSALLRLQRTVPAVCLTAAWAAVLLAPPSVKPLAAVLAGTVGGALALAALAFAPRPLPREARGVLAAFGLGLAALLAGVFALPFPLVSLFGVVGQHNGWLLWALVALWFAIGALSGRGTPLRAIVWSVAALGAVAGVFALLDAAHLFEAGVRYSPEVAGLMESSISLGQVLVLGVGAAAALVAIERSRAMKLAAGAVLAVQLAALAVSGARAAQLAVVAAALVTALWVAGGRLAPGVRRALWALVAIAAAAAVAAVVAIAALGPAAPRAVTGALTDRATIWHSAFVRARGHLLVGEGPDRFTAVVTWSEAPGGGVAWTATNSPHDVLLDWLLGGGVPALAAFLAAFALAGRALARRLASVPAGPRLLALAVSAWALSLLTSWTDPLAAVAAALVAGALLAEAERPARHAAALPASAGAVVATALVVLALGLPLLGLERAWAAERAVGASDAAAAEARWERWPDPAFGSVALRASMEALPSSSARCGRLASEVLTRTPWDANDAIESVYAIFALDRVQPPVPHPALSQALAVGRGADPASAIWSRLAALTRAR